MIFNYKLCYLNPKKKWIFCPTNKSKEKGYKFVLQILEKWAPPSYFYHLRPGGHIAAIKAHQNNKYFCKIDISNFFTNIRKNRVLRSLKKIKFSPNSARHISEWSTVNSKDDRLLRILPYGFVQSQLIASVCLDCSALEQASLACLRK